MNKQLMAAEEKALEISHQVIRQVFIDIAGSRIPLDDLCYIVDFIMRGMGYKPQPTDPAGAGMSQEEKTAYDRLRIDLFKAFIRKVGYSASPTSFEAVLHYHDYYDSLKENYLSCPALRSFYEQVCNKIQDAGGAA